MKHKPTVLLIDDDQELINLYTIKFNLDGTCKLETADSPARGLDMAKQNHPNLILLDLILPKHVELGKKLDKENGFELLETLKTDPTTKDIPVVVLTNLDEQTQDNVERAKALGAVDYWVKAYFTPGEVVAKVKQIII